MHPDEEVMNEAIFTADAALRLLFTIDGEHLDAIFQGIKIVSILLSFLQKFEDMEDKNNKKNLSKAGRIFTELIDLSKICLKKNLSTRLPCYDLKSVDKELQVNI